VEDKIKKYDRAEATTTCSQPQAEFTGVEGHMMTTDLTKQQLKLTGDLNAAQEMIYSGLSLSLRPLNPSCLVDS